MTSLKNYSKWDNLELSDDEDNFHPNIDNNLMIRLQREKRQQREAEEAEQLRKLREDGSETALAQIAKMEKTKKLHVDNICSEKFNSKHEKSSAASSANPTAHVEQKVKVTPFDESNFTDGRADGAVHHRPPGAAERARDRLLLNPLHQPPS